MKTKITLLLLINLTVTLSYGQYDWTEGSLVLKNGDTLIGQIELPMISKNIIAFNGEEKVKFRKDRKSEKVKYDETQVAKVIFKNSDTEIAYFEYVKLSEKEKGLFKVITVGKVTLYARSVSVSSGNYMYGGGFNGGGMWAYSYSDFNEFYALKDSETIASPLITAGIPRSFKKRAIEYFYDCPTLVSKLENGIYLKDDIREVVNFYNKCQ
jgi:hypothetical protein